MNVKFLMSLCLVFVLSVLVVQAQPVTIESVEINGDLVTPTDTNRLDLERGQTLDVKVRLNAIANGTDVEVHGFVSGFEFNRDQPISDVTSLFDVEAGVTYVKRLSLKLPDLAEEDNYLLRILVTDRNGAELIQSYRIKIDVPRHNVVIKDVILNPDISVVAGRALIATVRVKNMGEQDQDGVKVKVSIPDLEISATDFIDNLEADESTTSEELYLRIPTCARPGVYDVVASISFNEGFETAAKTGKIEVVRSDACPSATQDKKEKTMIIVSTEAQSITSGEGGVVYPITLSNEGSTTKVYTIVPEGYSDWGEIKLSPSNVVVLNAGEAKTVSMFVSAKPDASKGEKTFTVTVKDQAGNVLQQVIMKANVQAPKSEGSADLRRILEIGLIVLAVIVIVVALIVLFSRMRGREEEEEEPETKTYY